MTTPLRGLVGHGATDECIRPGGNVLVMRATTLKASSDRLGGVLAYYAGLAEDRTRVGGRARGPVDYYLDPDEPPGRWWGQGLGAVGLSGEVAGEDLRLLLDDGTLSTGMCWVAGSATPRPEGSTRPSRRPNQSQRCGG